MKKSLIALIAAVVLVAAAAGYLLGRQGQQTSGAAAGNDATGTSGQRTVLYWKGPMDPNFRSDKPGKSPMGMDLVPVYADDSGSSEQQ